MSKHRIIFVGTGRMIFELVISFAAIAGALFLIFFLISMILQEKDPKTKLDQEQCQSRCYPNSVNNIRPCQCDLTKVILND